MRRRRFLQVGVGLAVAKIIAPAAMARVVFGYEIVLIEGDFSFLGVDVSSNSHLIRRGVNSRAFVSIQPAEEIPLVMFSAAPDGRGAMSVGVACPDGETYVRLIFGPDAEAGIQVRNTSEKVDLTFYGGEAQIIRRSGQTVPVVHTYHHCRVIARCNGSFAEVDGRGSIRTQSGYRRTTPLIIRPHLGSREVSFSSDGRVSVRRNTGT